MTGDYTAQDGDVLTGTLSGDVKLDIAAGATVTLDNVNITLSGGNYAGIIPLGDATIILKGENVVKSAHSFTDTGSNITAVRLYLIAVYIYIGSFERFFKKCYGLVFMVTQLDTLIISFRSRYV